MSSFGEDFGRNGDFSVFWPLRSSPTWCGARRSWSSCAGAVSPAGADPVLYRGPPAAADRRRPGRPRQRQYLAEIARQRYGARVEQVMLSAQWYARTCRATRPCSRTEWSSCRATRKFSRTIARSKSNMATRTSPIGAIRRGATATPRLPARSPTTRAVSARRKAGLHAGAAARGRERQARGARDPFGLPEEDEAPLAVRAGRARAWAWVSGSENFLTVAHFCSLGLSHVPLPDLGEVPPRAARAAGEVNL